eukprot:TRINITY_DN3170_c0_g1_i4.p1 TRINITY_DN3170_c0_g1~~TRINITY_DN3170_c0_g1_i4.p1  ORF type:complete len:360 (+),score=70.84 TRINITY_DN3170_c0_g1_i4:1460-2539(+)
MADTLHFKGAKNLRHRIVCSLLSRRTVCFSELRSLSETPGLRDYEVSFLRMIEKITNGTFVEINETGTKLRFKPGFIVGGRNITHSCPLSRSVGYFLEPLIWLGPCGKQPLNITLTGITNDDTDSTVDIIRTVTLPLLTHVGLDDGLELQIGARGAPPKGGGKVTFKCPNVRKFDLIDLTDSGMISRVRGIVYTARVQPAQAMRAIDSARKIMYEFCPNVFIYTDHYKGSEAGLSPGYGVSLVAESDTKCLLSAESMACAGELPEDVGKRATEFLMKEVLKGGCVDSTNQSALLLFMVLGPNSVSRLRVSKLTSYTINCLRDYRDFFGTTFKMETDTESKTVVLSCVGNGFTNQSKKIK